MSKYIIDTPDGVEWGVVTCRTEDGFYTRDFDSLEELNSDYINEHYGQLQDDAYQRGLDDAWEAARKIVLSPDEGGMSLTDIYLMFGNSGSMQRVFRSYSASEAIDKLKAYEEKQKTDNEIKVGDEVETKDGKRFVVTTFGSGFDGDIAVGVCADGLGLGVDLKELCKTGRHFDIASILKEMQND